MISKKIAEVLRHTGNPKCIAQAKMLDASGNPTTTLHLRNLGLNSNDIHSISDILRHEKDTATIESVSFSYNEGIGDRGTILLASSLPHSITEIGLVACGIGDAGGTALLHWMKTAPTLKMICMEHNHFSEQLQLQFLVFKRKNPGILVVL